MNLTDPIFHNEDAARAHLEALRWPNGPVCPHCGNADPDMIRRLEGKSHRPGLFQCNECRQHFTVTINSVMERSHVPLTKWVLGFHLMASSKKGMSAHQLHRMLDITYKSAWFLAHRIREAMTVGAFSGPLGGKNEVVEADEAYVGGKAKNRAHRQPAPKKAVFSLIERDGRVASFHVANVSATTLRPIIVKHASRKSVLMTDEAPIYSGIGKEFAAHRAVNHSVGEYARMGGYVHTNTAENFYSILKRGIIGTYHHVSEAHLGRYLAEFDFRHNHRSGLGVSDSQRASAAIRGAEGKRLTYKKPREAAHA